MSSVYEMAFAAGKALGMMKLVKLGSGLLPEEMSKYFVAMQQAAAKDGIQLTLSSGFRTMAEQVALYARYLATGSPLAAKPGYSNHQSGKAVDINVGGNNQTSPEYKWLAANAKRFGFVNTGANFSKVEYWHWDWTKP